MALLLHANNIRQRRRRRLQVPAIIRDRRNPLDFMDDNELLKKYRMNRQSIFELCNVLDADLSRQTHRHGSLPVSLQVTVAMRFYATGSFLSVLADGHGISISSASRCVRDVSYYITLRLKGDIAFPMTDAEQRVVKQGFYDIAQFPQVLGTVDGTFIPIKAPSQDEHLFVTRKGYHAINVQGICDAKNAFLNIVVRWPGSTHDAYMLANSEISDLFESQRIQDGWLLGDSAYPLRSWLMTPLSERRNAAERRYNTAHKKTRCVVERTFGVWKMRFRCLHKSGGYLSLTPDRSVRVIMATAILHTRCVRNRVPLPDDDSEDDHDENDDDDDDNDDDNDDDLNDNGDNIGSDNSALSGREMRASLIERVFNVI